MQSVSSRFWTRVAVYNSYDDNHYSTYIYNDDDDDDELINPKQDNHCRFIKISKFQLVSF